LAEAALLPDEVVVGPDALFDELELRPHEAATMTSMRTTNQRNLFN
jgi:hypothetical protein